MATATKQQATYKWQPVAGRFTGWVQAGPAPGTRRVTGPQAKCGAHYVANGTAVTTACGRMAVRGNTPPQGHTHYKLHWYPLANAGAATGALCVACKAHAVAGRNPVVRAPKVPPVAPAATVAA